MLEQLRELSALLTSGSAGLTADGLLALGIISLAALLFAVALLRDSGDYRVTLRPIAAYDRLKQTITDAAESGDAIHLSAGSGTVGTSGSAETLAGVQAVASLLRRAATARVATLTTTSSALVLPLLQTAAEQACRRAGAPCDYDPERVRFAGDDRTAYAVHMTDALRSESIASSMLLGSLAEETLLIGERSRTAGVTQVTGAASTRAIPYAIATADAVIIGEEIYAAGAYLGGQVPQKASLQVQDWLRLVVVFAILAGVIVRSLG
jgi:hypothetical protein